MSESIPDEVRTDLEFVKKEVWLRAERLYPPRLGSALLDSAVGLCLVALFSWLFSDDWSDRGLLVLLLPVVFTPVWSYLNERGRYKWYATALELLDHYQERNRRKAGRA